MQLHPASLGTLQIQIASKGGVVTANFLTQNEAVKTALESQMVQLKEQFAEQGVKVEAIEVSVQTREFERNLDQGREGGQNRESSRRGRGRRLRLDDALAGEETQQESLQTAGLSAGGSTVEYRA
ncbi:MAG: flagellar hook-length control protein FliK [Roseburia sp.]|nr:flagellar hook-length control protein FliK [Roseburia sp.]MCM1096971.1 flagellar hook-length control protein FliK [Ruminococcus flavefaciens]